MVKSVTELNQKDIEVKWQKIWKKEKVFEPEIDAKKEKYFSTVPYPYANSVLHIGHGRGYTTPDIFVRYQRLIGKNVLFPLGFHITGTPVLAVADSIKNGDKKQLKLTKEAISDYVSDESERDELVKSFENPYEIAKFFSSTIEGSLDSIGISIDWTRKFSTGDETYQKFVEWQFKKLSDCSLLVQGKYPILYSVADGNAVGEDDIKDGDVDKVSVSEMTYILFKLKDSDEFFAVATLRPDALFGTTNLWIDSKGKYLRIEVNSQIWIVSADSLVKLEHQFDSVRVLSKHKGSEFMGKFAITPIINREVIIAQASFLDSKQGTGLAYSSPAGSPHDFMGLKEAVLEGRLHEDVKVINTVETKDKKGSVIKYRGSCPAEDKCIKFGVSKSTDFEKLELAKTELYKEEHYGGKLNDLCGEFSGIYVKAAKEKVTKRLIELNLGGVFYETSRRAVTRGGNEVIVANLDGQWFLDYSGNETKRKALNLLDAMSYNPSKLRDTQRDYLNWVMMRPCARRRGIGTLLPFDPDWVIESLSDSTIYQMLYLIQNIITRERLDAKQLSFELFDYVYLGEGNLRIISEQSRIPEKVIEEMRNSVLYWKSFDFRYTAGAHMSNHLSFLIYHYALIFPKDLHPKNITIGGMLVRNGEKISKSKGNGIPLVRVHKKFGSDLYRLYVALAANYDVEMDFRDDEIFQLEDKFNKWKTLIVNSIKREVKRYDDFSQTNKWLISKFYSRVREYFSYMDSLRIREAYVGILYEFLNDLNYHKRRCGESETFDVIRFVAKDYVNLMTPAIPHICEELWQMLEGKGYSSLAVFKTVCDKFIDKHSEDVEGFTESILRKISIEKESKQIKGLKEVKIVQAGRDKFKLFDAISENLERTKEVKEIFSNLNRDFSDDKKFISKFVPKTLRDGLSFYMGEDEQRQFICDLIPFLEKEFGCRVEVVSNDDLENKVYALPNEVGVILSD